LHVSWILSVRKRIPWERSLGRVFARPDSMHQTQNRSAIDPIDSRRLASCLSMAPRTAIVAALDSPQAITKTAVHSDKPPTGDRRRVANAQLVT